MKPKTPFTKQQQKLFRFVICFTGECCADPHLWGVSVHAETPRQAKQRAIAIVIADKSRAAFEIIEVTHGLGTVEEIRHQGVVCIECETVIQHEDEGESSCCGSVHDGACFETHTERCGGAS